MEAFATIEDYDARFPGRTASDGTLAECLMDATLAIADVLGRRGIDYADPTEELAERMMRTCRAVANRLVPAGSDVPVGVTQMALTAGSYNQTVSYTPSYGLPKLLPSELDMLGLGGGGRVGWAPLGARHD